MKEEMSNAGVACEWSYLLDFKKGEAGELRHHGLEHASRSPHPGLMGKAMRLITSRKGAHEINVVASTMLFIKAFAGTAGFVAMRFWLQYIGYEGTTPVPSVTAFMAGTYFVLSMLLKGILDEYTESGRIPNQVWSASHIVSNVVDGIVTGICAPGKGIADIATLLDGLEELQGLHIKLSKIENNHLHVQAAVTLTKQTATVRKLLLRADHVSRSAYLPVGTAFSWLLAICSVLVLGTVDTAGWVVECTLLPSLLLFVFLFALFAAEIDDPFDMDSSVSVSIETLRVLRVAMKDWADNETKAQAQTD